MSAQRMQEAERLYAAELREIQRALDREIDSQATSSLVSEPSLSGLQQPLTSAYPASSLSSSTLSSALGIHDDYTSTAMSRADNITPLPLRAAGGLTAPPPTHALPGSSTDQGLTRRFEDGLAKAKRDLEAFKRQFASMLGSEPPSSRMMTGGGGGGADRTTSLLSPAGKAAVAAATATTKASPSPTRPAASSSSPLRLAQPRSPRGAVRRSLDRSFESTLSADLGGEGGLGGDGGDMSSFVSSLRGKYGKGGGGGGMLPPPSPTRATVTLPPRTPPSPLSPTTRGGGAAAARTSITSPRSPVGSTRLADMIERQAHAATVAALAATTPRQSNSNMKRPTYPSLTSPRHASHLPSPPSAPLSSIQALNSLLRENGFSALPTGGLEDDGAFDDEETTAMMMRGNEEALTLAHALAALAEVCSQYARRNKLIQELLSQREEARAKENARDTIVASLKAELAAAKRETLKAQRLLDQAKLDEKEKETRRMSTSSSSPLLDAETNKLKSRLNQLEHALKQKEVEMDKLRRAMSEKQAREERRAARDKEVYDKLKRVHASMTHPTSSTNSGRSPAGSISAAVRELRPLEIVSLYETQREQLETELSGMRRELKTTSEELKEAKNLIQRKDATNAWTNPAAEAEDRLLTLERQLVATTRELTETRAQHAASLVAMQRREEEALRRVDRVAEENAAMILELESRPLPREVKSLRRQLEALERQLARARSLGGSDLVGGVAEQQEALLQAAGAASSATLSTRDAMRRDRELHRLGLEHVEQLPRDVLVDLVQDACIALEMRDATSLPAQLARVLRAVGIVPTLERFTRDVCDVVLRLGAPFLPSDARGAALLGSLGGPGGEGGSSSKHPSGAVAEVVPRVLKGWIQKLHALEEAEGCLTAMDTELKRRIATHPDELASSSLSPSWSHATLLASVRQLVDVERAALSTAATIRAAESAMSSDPDVLLHRIVSHFQHLFDSPRIEGVLPRMNQVYVSLNEGRNLQRGLALLMGLPSDANANAVAAAVRGMVQMGGGMRGGNGGASGRVDVMADDYAEAMREAQREDKRDEKHRASVAARDAQRAPLSAVVLPSGDIVWESRTAEETKTSGGGGGGGGDKRDVDHVVMDRVASATATHAASLDPVATTQAIQAVMSAVHASSPIEAVRHVERLVTRLTKLDDVLPRYQNTVRRLFDVLRVASLEDIVPAVERMMR